MNKTIPVAKESTITRLRDVLKVGAAEYFLQLFVKYGDIVTWKYPPAQILVSHPDYAKHIYLANAANYFKKPALQVKINHDWLGEGLESTNNYKLWKKNHEIIDPVFFNKNFKDYAAKIIQNCSNMLGYFDTAAENNTTVNLNLYFSRLAIYNLITTIFNDIDLDYEKFITYIHERLMLVNKRLYSLTDLAWRLPTQDRRRWSHVVNTVNQMIDNIIQKRLNQPDLGNDVLGELLKNYINESDRKQALHQVRDEVMTLLFGGHDTIALTLTWCVTALSLHPEVERRVRHEIDTVINNRLPTYEDIKSLPYTQAVLSETLRLYPVAPYMAREASAEDEMNGYSIAKGSALIVSIFNIHRHPDFWPNPQAFDPERFLKNPWYQHQSFAFIPGTAGERHCIGIRYALMEGCLALVTMLQRYRFSLPVGENFKPKFYVFWNSEEVMMKVERVK